MHGWLMRLMIVKMTFDMSGRTIIGDEQTAGTLPLLLCSDDPTSLIKNSIRFRYSKIAVCVLYMQLCFVLTSLN